MNRIQKAAAAAMALTITLTGATFAVAPMALADSKPVIARVHGWSATHLHHLAADLRAASSATRAG